MSRTIDLAGGVLRYHDTGSGPAVVFVHGLLTNSTTWRDVVPPLVAAGYRCITPDLPLGSHNIPMPGADLTVQGVASIVEELIERLDLHEATLVGNDSGGAITQVLLARKPARVSRVVLAGVDCYENFPPPTFRWITALSGLPGSVALLAATMRLRPLHRLPFVFGRLTVKPIPRDVMDGYLQPTRDSAAIRDDVRRFVRSVNPSHTLAAARTFGDITLPVLVVWGRKDRIIDLQAGERLAQDFPNATLRVIDDAAFLLQEDQPAELAEHLLEFLAATNPATVASTTEAGAAS